MTDNTITFDAIEKNINQISLIQEGRLSALELECLHKVSECILEMRSVIRKKADMSLSRQQLGFLYESLDACHNIPRVIAENHSSAENSDALDWLLRSNLEAINIAASRYRDGFSGVQELVENKQKIPNPKVQRINGITSFFTCIVYFILVSIVFSFTGLDDISFLKNIAINTELFVFLMLFFIAGMVIPYTKARTQDRSDWSTLKIFAYYSTIKLSFFAFCFTLFIYVGRILFLPTGTI